MSQNFMKITYHSAAQKISAYLNMPSPTFSVLKKEIEMCLFEERGQPRHRIRTFWIDDDQDEIEIINQCDYDVFLAKHSERLHLQVAPLGLTADEPAVTETSEPSNNSNNNQDKVPPAAGSYDFAVHDKVECDGCLMAPIVGFRYKCIQCTNYDLCQNCEAKHIHSEHMMVRMPTNNCPRVVESYITGGSSSSGRKHGKRSKTSCPFVKTGISVVVNDEEENSNGDAGESGAQSARPNGKERNHGRKHHRHHSRNNFFANLYEMMNDLAEGGGAAAAAYATGEEANSSTSTKTTTTTSGPHITTSIFTNGMGFGNKENAANFASKMAAQHAHEAAMKASEMASKVAQETAKNITKTMFASTTSTAPSDAGANAGEKENETTKEKVNTTTSSQESGSQPNSIPVTPSLETISQFLDPQYMKTGMQILNNFSDMFAKMLDPMINEQGGSNKASSSSNTNLNKNSTSAKSSVSSNLNSMGSEKKSEKEILNEKEQNKETEQQENHDSSFHMEIVDLGSDSENDSVSESFVKLDAPKEANTSKDSHITTPSTPKSVATSAQTTPPQSLNKSNVMDFAQLSANLKAHIAEEAAKKAIGYTESVDSGTEKVANAGNVTTETIICEPVVTTTTSTNTAPEERRAVPVYHADQRINDSVLAMMSMGFSNEGAWLTQLLESVNGNISEALDLMPVAQFGGQC